MPSLCTPYDSLLLYFISLYCALLYFISLLFLLLCNYYIQKLIHLIGITVPFTVPFTVPYNHSFNWFFYKLLCHIVLHLSNLLFFCFLWGLRCLYTFLMLHWFRIFLYPLNSFRFGRLNFYPFVPDYSTLFYCVFVI